MKSKCVVIQQDFKDCGVCSLLSVIKYYNGYVSMEKLRVDTLTNMEGTNALNIINASKSYGFDAYGIKCDNICDLENIIMPAIAHVVLDNLNHFVVIYKISNNKITIMDPAKGRVVMPLKEFENVWSKNLIILYPKNKIIIENNKNYLKGLLFRVLHEKKKLILEIIFLTILFSLFTIITSFYFKVILNVSYDLSSKIICIFFFNLMVIKFFIYIIRNYYKLTLNKHIDGIIYSDFIEHLFSLPNYFIKNRTTGEIMTRISEVGNLKMIISEFLIALSVDGITALSAGIIICKINLNIFLIIILFVVIYLLYGIYEGKKIYYKAIDSNEAEISFNTNIIETIDTYTSFKNLNIMNLVKRKVNTCLFKYLTKLNIFDRRVLKSTNFSYIIEELLNFSLVTIAIFYISKQSLNITDFIIIESLVGYFTMPFKTLINIIPSYNYFKISLNKLNEFYNVTLEDDSIGIKDFKNDDIIINNLSYSYDNYNMLFDNFSLKIKKNSFILFKGRSGCGKSTICQILSRLIENKNNNIYIGESSINDYSLKTYRQNIMYIGQKESLLQDTIRNNIILNRKIKEEDFKEIVDICHIEDIVSRKALRFETEILKDATNISGGEKQRIILARALLSYFEILILDEALSEVNKDLEQNILDKLRKKFKDKTIIYVSHKNYDNIFDEIIDFESL